MNRMQLILDWAAFLTAIAFVGRGFMLLIDAAMFCVASAKAANAGPFTRAGCYAVAAAIYIGLGGLFLFASYR